MSFNPDRDIPSLAGKVIFITGGTAGLGAVSIMLLAKHDPAHIYFSGRNDKTAQELIQKVKNTTPGAKLTFIRCNLASMASVQAAARSFNQASDHLDILYCNAGIMAVNAGVTKEGYEIQFGTNHIGHALLIKLLLPVMLETAKQPGADVRIINMSSIAYQQAPSEGIDFATLKSPQKSLGKVIPGAKWSRYGQSKLANMLYPQELAKRHPSITSVSVHPGVIITGLFDRVSFMTKLPVLISSIGKRTPVEQGPYNQLWAGTCPRSKLTNGEYYEPIGVLGKRTTSTAKDPKLAERLWAWTEKEIDFYK